MPTVATSKLIAYHGDKKIKAKYLKRVEAHRKADELIKGTGWDNGKGCAIGCTLNSYEHRRYETELGIPLVLAKLEDAIFEGLPNKLAMLWPSLFLQAIKPGADLSKVHQHLMLFNLRCVEPLAKGDGLRAVQRVIKLYVDILAGAFATPEAQYKEAEAAAAEAAEAEAAGSRWVAGRWAEAEAAAAGRWAAGRWAEGRWAEAAEAAAEAAAGRWAEAAEAAAAAAGRENHYIRLSEKLLELLANAPMVK